ncbi:hypothetical protein QOZ96_003400 [Brevundimonas nasdae]|uniref:hypothetical protein n=1 Tax=Brevundimonas nasdae TaxID=172043 RepID=UPI001911F1A9|nr:hypothetical protein [Brevundimonas nasdae]MBK6026682.1 hypothetical protein [Brevundimonas nasdae]MDQ0453430.1 hypothetical protein [Brevundimonas nasdae]
METPARHLSRISRGQVLGLLLVVGLGVLAVALFEAEGVRIYAMAAPELTGWVLMFDATVVFDMMVLAISLRAAASWRGLVRQTRTVVSIAARMATTAVKGVRSRARRIRPLRPPSDESSEIEPDAVFA